MVDDKTKLTFTTAQDTIINSYFEEWHDIMANESGTDKRLGRSDPPDYPNAITPKKWCEDTGQLPQHISKRFNNHKKIKVTATGLAGLTPVVQSSTTHDSNLTSTSTFFCCGALTGRMPLCIRKKGEYRRGNDARRRCCAHWTLSNSPQDVWDGFSAEEHQAYNNRARDLANNVPANERVFPQAMWEELHKIC
ncbi:hypothetical protein B0H10DRAFT_1946294 [Mycena sp. CBHHK59/15]|nr:hypothetical protein B0H10DRAFT_1946294 [Mycena sp. CBHHK59/15]